LIAETEIIVMTVTKAKMPLNADEAMSEYGTVLEASLAFSAIDMSASCANP